MVVVTSSLGAIINIAENEIVSNCEDSQSNDLVLETQMVEFGDGMVPLWAPSTYARWSGVI